MRKTGLMIALILVLTSALTGCGGEVEKPDADGTANGAVTINISAAASLTDALTEIKAAYAKESSAILQMNFAASGSLQKQIEEGAPCDLFISASNDHMDALDEEGLIVRSSRKDILGNTLTLIASAEKADQITVSEAFTDQNAGSISIGTPDSVPAGKYAQQTFEHLGVWDEIQPKLVLAKDVRQVLQYVDSGNVDCGLVYKSDALQLESGVIIRDIPVESHDPIVYPAALIKNSAQPEAAAEFYDFLQTDFAKSVFEKYGFTILT